MPCNSSNAAVWLDPPEPKGVWYGGLVRLRVPTGDILSNGIHRRVRAVVVSSLVLARAVKGGAAGLAMHRARTRSATVSHKSGLLPFASSSDCSVVVDGSVTSTSAQPVPTQVSPVSRSTCAACPGTLAVHESAYASHASCRHHLPSPSSKRCLLVNINPASSRFEMHACAGLPHRTHVPARACAPRAEARAQIVPSTGDCISTRRGFACDAAHSKCPLAHSPFQVGGTAACPPPEIRGSMAAASSDPDDCGRSQASRMIGRCAR